MLKLDLSTKQWLFVLFLFFIFLYSLFQARFVILGPQIRINYPRNGEVLTDEIVTLAGTAKNVAWITLNDRQIFVDEDGLWSEKLIAPFGSSIMTLKARDRFGREEIRRVEIIVTSPTQ